MDEILKLLENLKCCGNCEYDSSSCSCVSSDRCSEQVNGGSVCDQWFQDTLTYTDRKEF